MITKSGKEAVHKLFETHLVPRAAVDVLLRKPFSPEDFDEYIGLREEGIRREIFKMLSHVHIDEILEEAVDIEEDVIDEEFLFSPDLMLFCKSKNADARANPGRGKRILVLKDSKVAPKITASFVEHNYNKNFRIYLLGEGILAKRGDYLVFTEDYEFPSPSAAAAVILGRAADGPSAWKDEKGNSLYELSQDSAIPK
jgi:hypothetical protein